MRFEEPLDWEQNFSLPKGIYTYIISCNASSEQSSQQEAGSLSEGMQVLNGSSTFPVDNLEAKGLLFNITIILVLIIIGLLFALFAEISSNLFWYIVGGIWFLAAAPTIAIVLIGISSLLGYLGISFFSMVGVVMIYEAVQQSLRNKREEAD